MFRPTHAANAHINVLELSSTPHRYLSETFCAFGAAYHLISMVFYQR